MKDQILLSALTIASICFLYVFYEHNRLLSAVKEAFMEVYGIDVERREKHMSWKDKRAKRRFEAKGFTVEHMKDGRIKLYRYRKMS